MVTPSLLEVSDYDARGTAAPRMSEEEFVAWAMAREGNVEWVDGEVILMSPAAVKHIRITCWLDRTLGIYIQSKRLGELFASDLMVRLQSAKVSRRVPDLSFISKTNLGRLQSNHFDGPPDLAIEVVSPDSRDRDWQDKFSEYEASGVLEYWIIDPMTERFSASFRNAEGKFTTVELADDGALHAATVPGFWLKPEWLWRDELPDSLDCLRELGVLG